MLWRNPWDETPGLDRIREIRRDIELARRVAVDANIVFPKISKDIQKFVKSLDRITVHLAAYPDDWRRIRSLMVVDIPAILQAMEGATNLPEGEARTDLVKRLPAALEKASLEAASMERTRADALAIGLDVLPGAEAIPAEEAPAAGISGRLTGFGRGAMSAVTGTLETSRDVSSRVVGSAVSTAGAVTALSGEHLGGFLGSASRTITNPVTNRVKAMADALAEGSAAALILGGIASLVFPPIAPFVVGEAVLRMPEAYAANLADMNQAEARAELIRNGEKADRIAGIMAALHGGPVRFDTPCLSMTMDPRTGKASGIVLSGAHTGEMVENIEHKEVVLMRDKSPDEETRRALTAWLERA
jgi:hypothetical protein